MWTLIFSLSRIVLLARYVALPAELRIRYTQPTRARVQQLNFIISFNGCCTRRVPNLRRTDHFTIQLLLCKHSTPPPPPPFLLVSLVACVCCICGLSIYRCPKTHARFAFHACRGACEFRAFVLHCAARKTARQKNTWNGPSIKGVVNGIYTV